MTVLSKPVAFSPAQKSKHFFALLKFRLSLLVVFSSGFGYLMGWNGADFQWGRFLAFCLGSFIITGAANTINQIIERDVDKLMARTKERPLPTNALSISEVVIFSVLMTILGTAILALGVSVGTAVLGLLSLLLYAFVYTPMKGVSSFAVFIGAFPGAFPPLIGWFAGGDQLTWGAMVIFGIQFIWQFPHFWAIAWLAHDDYLKVGYNLLPTGARDFGSSIQIVIYTICLLPFGLMPWWMGITGEISAVIVTIAGLLFLVPAVQLLLTESRKAARTLMFASFLYLPVMQIAFVLDKI
ncbi:MAG: heme o synthase [Bacteroidota bacterium]